MNFGTDQLKEYEQFVKYQIIETTKNPNSFKNDPWYIGIRRAYENAEHDKYTPSIEELNIFLDKEKKKSEKSLIKFLMFTYYNKKADAQEFLFKFGKSLSDKQYDKILNDLTDIVFRICSLSIQIWRKNAINAEKNYNELIKSETENKKKKEKKKKKRIIMTMIHYVSCVLMI